MCPLPSHSDAHLCPPPALRSYPFEIHDDALVLRKMLEHEGAQQRGGSSSGHEPGTYIIS
jgi:hypothetical protein